MLLLSLPGMNLEKCFFIIKNNALSKGEVMIENNLSTIETREFDRDYFTAKRTPALVEYDYYIMRKNRQFFINGEINDDLLDEVGLPIIKFNQEDSENNIPITERKKIVIYLNTFGGDPDTALTLADIIKNSKTPIEIIAFSKVCSAGIFILLATNIRKAYKHSYFLIHEGVRGGIDSTSKAQEFFEFVKVQEKYIKEFIIQNTKITDELYSHKYKEEWYFDTKGALKYGLITEII